MGSRLCTDGRTWSYCRHKSLKRCRCSAGDRPPTALGHREQDIPDWLTEGLAEGHWGSCGSAGDTIPQNTSSTCSRETLEPFWTETPGLTIQFQHPQMYFAGCALNAAAAGEETIRVSSNRKHPEPHGNPSFHMKYTSRLSAWMVLCSGNSEFQCVQILHCIQPLCEDQDFARVMASTREISRFGGGSMDSGASESKTSNTSAKQRT